MFPSDWNLSMQSEGYDLNLNYFTKSELKSCHIPGDRWWSIFVESVWILKSILTSSHNLLFVIVKWFTVL